jgi:hypothetical protein
MKEAVGKIFPKKSIAKYFAGVLFLCFLACSCSSFDLPLVSGRGWTRRKASRGTIRIGTIRADKSSEWNSLEREIEGLLPLLLLERGYMPTVDSTQRDVPLRIDAVVIEREYLSGWLTRRSLSAEIRIWKDGDELPLAAGRAVLSGDRSLASTKVLSRLLRLALSKALAGLEKVNPK